MMPADHMLLCMPILDDYYVRGHFGIGTQGVLDIRRECF